MVQFRKSVLVAGPMLTVALFLSGCFDDPYKQATARNVNDYELGILNQSIRQGRLELNVLIEAAMVRGKIGEYQVVVLFPARKPKILDGEGLAERCELDIAEFNRIVGPATSKSLPGSDAVAGPLLSFNYTSDNSHSCLFTLGSDPIPGRHFSY